ncbi:histidinol-phosphate transaminase [candidate division KSB1 bacterium]|nr:histidinol-phosphate transaminase [candidate division KSB1 bacterium]
MIKPKKTLAQVTPYQLPEQSRMDKIRLDLNENTWGCSPRVLQRIRDLSLEEIATYPEYNLFIDKLASYYGLQEENIILSNGADDSIRTVFDTYLEQNNEVILPVPTYSMFDFFAKIRGAKLVEILYNDDFSFPVQKVLNHITESTKIIVIVSPANPLGTAISRQDLEVVLNEAGDALVLLDETYHHFMNETYSDLIQRYENLVIIQTFSKIYALAGLRLGITLAQDKVINDLNKINLPFAANVAAVKAAEVAIDDTDYLKEMIKAVDREKQYYHEQLKRLGYAPHESATNFIIVNFEEDSQVIYDRLRQKGILVKNLNNYPMLKGFLRISIGRHEENEQVILNLYPALKPEAIIFDMDGVLVDVHQSYRLAIKKTVEHFSGSSFDLDEIDSYKSKGGFNNDWRLTQEVLRERGISLDLETIIDTFHGFYLGEDFDGLILNETWLPDNKILQELRKRYKLGIFTGRPRLDAEFVLNRFNVKDYFSTMVTLDDIPRDKGKPHPNGLLQSLQLLDVHSAVYVGDTIDDMASAVAARVTPIGLLHHDFENSVRRFLLRKNGARLILPSVNELVEVLT